MAVANNWRGALVGLTCGIGVATLNNTADTSLYNYNTAFVGQPIPISEPIKERKAVSHYLKKAIMRKQ